MAEVVGGALLSVIFQALIDRMSREVPGFFRGRKLANGPLRKLKIRLLSVNAVLDDAEDKELTKPVVKEWLDELIDAVFDAEDILDEIDTKIQSLKLAAEFQTTAVKKSEKASRRKAGICTFNECRSLLEQGSIDGRNSKLRKFAPKKYLPLIDQKLLG